MTLELLTTADLETSGPQSWAIGHGGEDAIPGARMLSDVEETPSVVRVTETPGEVRIEVRGGKPRWLEPIVTRLRELIALPTNWDSYGAAPIRLSIVAHVIRLLAHLMGRETPLPHLVPTKKGGIQFEWPGLAMDLEVEVHATGQVEVYCEDLQTGERWEGDLWSNIRRVRAACQKIGTAM